MFGKQMNKREPSVGDLTTMWQCHVNTVPEKPAYDFIKLHKRCIATKVFNPSEVRLLREANDFRQSAKVQQPKNVTPINLTI